MTDTTMREAFEAWAKSRSMALFRDSTPTENGGKGDYEYPCTNHAWWAWQAATERATPHWQPIETAPRDGRTLLLGYYNSANKWRTMRGQWMDEDYIAEYWEYGDDVEPGWFETVVEGDDIPNCWLTDPTHWQPIPPPPAIRQGGAG